MTSMELYTFAIVVVVCGIEVDYADVLILTFAPDKHVAFVKVAMGYPRGMNGV